MIKMSPWWSFKQGRSKAVEEDSVVKNEKKIECEEVKRDVLLSENSLRNGKEFSFSGRESGDEFSGFPLPTPEESSDDLGYFLGVVWLGSDSSVSSSGSSDDHAAVRGNADDRFLRSQGQQVSVRTIVTPHAGSNDLDSPNKKFYGECHRLPLPPGSPYRPSTSKIPRSPRTEESSVWRKGKFIRRCTSGPLFLGFNSECGQMCTIKEVVAFSDDKVSRRCLEQLKQEKTLLSQLSHANIVQYYGFDLRGKTLSVYLEYMSRGSVLKLLQEYGPLGELVVQSYTRQVLSALVYLHGRKTVHRNIRGENIVINQNGDIRLVDFGMAKDLTSSSSVPFPEGSIHWMAPEVVMNASAYDLAADIWSLGCTVLEMATSKPPWSQYEGAAAIYKIGKSKDAPDISDHLSADAKSFIQLCLQREPSARPTAKQLLNHPFVRNQTTLTEKQDQSARPTAKQMLNHPSFRIKATSRLTDTNNVTREAFSQAWDGNHRQSATETQHNKTVIGSFKQYGRINCSNASRLTVPRTLIVPRDSVGTRCLPISPSGHVLNDGGKFNKSSLSPHSSITFAAQNNQNHGDESRIPVTPNSRSTPDPWLDTPQFGAGTPARFPTSTISWNSRMS